MLDSFTPPGIQCLSEVDIAKGVRYEGNPVVIQGIVSPEGQGGTLGNKGKYQVHQFHLAVWHRVGEQALHRDLIMLRPLPSEIDDFFTDFPAYSIQQFSVLVSTDGGRTVVKQVSPCDSPSEDLTKIIDELKQEIVVSTDHFGELVLNREDNWFEGEIEWDGVIVEFRMDSQQRQLPDESLQTAEYLWSNRSHWPELIKNLAVEELLQLRNEDWLEDDEEPLSASEFCAKIELFSISIYSGGQFEFSLDDGDLFAGHLIYVRGNVNSDKFAVGIAG